ncbi:hypothetical protein N7533_003548 [Penicillium manginii]|uniref:uncharacterized protein n=1 Tax=Penicillium manginii TaxID=203109 RepID=UPI0025467036|nr:uncharacterized protein N7533_003548 [Penicillium manginii]KAJ5761509.1 hypothetical protein N7533_003548 [Penicillium manginii]
MTSPSKTEVQAAIGEYIKQLAEPLRELNRKIHENPELAYEEHHSHDVICKFLEAQNIPVKRHVYGLRTAFEAIVGESSGRCVNFNAEYDALPGIGHACGHNLIATASVAGFMALAFAIQKFGLPGQAQLLGTPAEEDGGGKVDLIRAGAFKNVDVSLMMHPMAEDEFSKGILGIGGRSTIACFDITAAYHGVSAHAAASPWEGVNALDALVSAYNNISMLRQQIGPDERIHGAIMQAPTVTNAIPELTRTKYTIRSRTQKGARALGERVRKCLDAGALATGCKVELEENSDGYQDAIGDLGVHVVSCDDTLMPGSTDQGNVSQVVPALHALVGIPVTDGAHNHTRQFTAAAATDEAHERSVTSGKAMAMTGWRLLVDDQYYSKVRQSFDEIMG